MIVEQELTGGKGNPTPCERREVKNKTPKGKVPRNNGDGRKSMKLEWICRINSIYG